jgi:hypothetical protein
MVPPLTISEEKMDLRIDLLEASLRSVGARQGEISLSAPW